jgi:HK97 family phage major capsid protein/HK97 family phage prohead protease
MTIKQRPATLTPQCRTVSLRLLPKGEPQDGVVDLSNRVATLAFASETPVDMWYGTEILSMAPGAMRTGARQDSLPLLFNHDMDDLLGVVGSIAIGKDRVARADVRFGKDERGEWAMQQVADGVLVNVSFMYRVFKFVEDTEAETLTAIDWEPYEISLVTVPADPTVGAGRSADVRTENGVQIETRSAAATTPAPADSGAPGVSTAPGAHSNPATPQEQSMNVRFRGHQRPQEQANPDGGGGTGGTAVQATTVANGDTAVIEQRGAQRGAEAERARMTEIEALCKKYDVSTEVRTAMIQKGATIEQARVTVSDIVLERAHAAGKPAADFGGSHNPDLSERDKARYSMIRAVNASLNGKWDKAGFELECSNEVSKRLGRGPENERGFFIPTNIQFGQRAAYTVGTPGAGSTGGTLVATQLLAGSFIEVLRNKARVMSLGATILSGLVGSVTIPRQNGQSSTFWTTEGTNTTESEATFDSVSLSMKTIGTYSQVTRNMLMQSTPDIDMIARADLMAAVALGVDLASLSGSGTGGVPLGIANQSGIGSVVGGTNGAAVTINNLIDLETQVTAANAPEDSLAYLANAKTIGSLKKLVSTTGQYLWTANALGQRSGTPGEINGYTMARSNQARSTLTKGTSAGVCSEIFFGAWTELLIGEWGVVEIVPNPYDAAVFKNGGVLLRVLQSIDIAVRHAASFAVMSDALTP